MSKTNKVRIGIFGTGFGQTHAKIFLSFPDVEIIGIVGKDELKTMEVARSLGIQGYTDPEALIYSSDVDAIDVCFPTELHAKYVIAALNQDKDVFCETPVAYTMADAIQMRKTTKDKGKKLLVGLYGRFVRDYKHVHDYVVDARLGKVKVVYVNRRTPPIWGGAWDENFIMNLMLHDIDYVHWLLGRPIAVSSRGLENTGGGWNHVSISLEYQDANVVIEGCGIMPLSFPFSTSLRVVGDEGAIDLNWYWEGTAPVSEVKYFPNEGKPQILSTPDYDPYEAECRYFVDCLQGKAEPDLLSIETACDSLNIASIAKVSLEQSGKRIIV
jgi:UDP-N-acetylglucosamine 3-dehydrogenase